MLPTIPINKVILTGFYPKVNVQLCKNVRSTDSRWLQPRGHNSTLFAAKHKLFHT